MTLQVKEFSGKCDRIDAGFRDTVGEYYFIHKYSSVFGLFLKLVYSDDFAVNIFKISE